MEMSPGKRCIANSTQVVAFVFVHGICVVSVVLNENATNDNINMLLIIIIIIIIIIFMFQISGCQTAP